MRISDWSSDVCSSDLEEGRVGETRRYHVELWPLGNRFKAGHRIRLHIVGASAFHVPSLPAVHTVYVGGPNSPRLLLPVVPASALPAGSPASNGIRHHSTPPPGERQIVVGGKKGSLHGTIG